MNVQINGQEHFHKRFQTTDQFVEYIYLDGPSELTANTQFALESLLLSGILFIVSQAIAAYYRKTAANAQKVRHEEIIAKFNLLARYPSVSVLAGVLVDVKGTVEVVLDGEEMKLLEAPLQKLAEELPAIKIIERKPGFGTGDGQDHT